MKSNELLNLTLVLIAGLVAPMIHYAIRRTKVPAVVIEIVIGMIIGPDVLGWVKADATVKVVSTIGLSVLLYLAGNEIDIHSLRASDAKQSSDSPGRWSSPMRPARCSTSRVSCTNHCSSQ